MKRVVPWLLSLLVAFLAGRWIDAEIPRPASRWTAAVDAAASRLDPLAQLVALQHAVARRGAGGAHRAALATAAMIPQLNPLAMRVLVSAWARADAPAAWLWIQESWPSQVAFPKQEAASEVVRAWASADPVEALRAVEDDPESPESRDELRRALIQGWSRTGDLRGPTEYIAQLDPALPIRQHLATELARQLLKRGGPDAAIAWASAIAPDSPNQLKLVAHRKVAGVLAEFDPELAAAWIEPQMDRDYANGLLRIVATKWCDAAPVAALDWLRRQPASTERDEAMEFAFRAWLKRDVPAAREWITSQESDRALDPAFNLYARLQARHSPQMAIEIAKRIDDPAIREKAVIGVGRLWLGLDEGAARSWFESARLPATTIQKIEALHRRRTGRRGSAEAPDATTGIAP